jgi:hypothetical protein
MPPLDILHSQAHSNYSIRMFVMITVGSGIVGGIIGGVSSGYNNGLHDYNMANVFDDGYQDTWNGLCAGFAWPFTVPILIGLMFGKTMRMIRPQPDPNLKPQPDPNLKHMQIAYI